MKNVNGLMLVFAIAAAFSIMSIGITIAERSTIGILVSIAVFIIVMGLGFSTKKKIREKGSM